MADQLAYSEKLYFDSIEKNCKIIFDVGSEADSIFFNYEKEVHYFEPNTEHFNRLKKTSTKNSSNYCNNFGLSDSDLKLDYYSCGSFFDRSKCIFGPIQSDIINKFPVKRGDWYCDSNNIKGIDFLKIDVEGFELKVLIGFGNYLSNTKYIQFEYGIGLNDAGFKLSDITNYLIKFGFEKFYYQTNSGLVEVKSFDDDWRWCNICCSNKNLVEN